MYLAFCRACMCFGSTIGNTNNRSLLFLEEERKKNAYTLIVSPWKKCRTSKGMIWLSFREIDSENIPNYNIMALLIYHARPNVLVVHERKKMKLTIHITLIQRDLATTMVDITMNHSTQWYFFSQISFEIAYSKDIQRMALGALQSGPQINFRK